MRLLLIVIAVIGVSSCGGGSNSVIDESSSSISSYRGVAIDGYLSLATVCLDLNDNGSCDANEPSATTDSTGGFTIYATQDQINSHSVIGKAIAGKTIDLDSPSAAITGDMTLTVPTGKHSVVSPLTTLVQAKVEAGQTLAASITAVQTELGLTTIDPMKNYVSEKVTNSAYADAHKIAASIAELLKTIESQSSSNTTLSSKLSSLATSVTTNLAPIATQIKSSSSLDDARNTLKNSIAQAAKIYTVGGSISGLSTSGLVIKNGNETLNITSTSTNFTFSNKLATGDNFSVSIDSQPTDYSCSISGGAGTVSTQSISNVIVSCVYVPSPSVFINSSTIGNVVSLGYLRQMFFDGTYLYVVNSTDANQMTSSGGKVYKFDTSGAYVSTLSSSSMKWPYSVGVYNNNVFAVATDTLSGTSGLINLNSGTSPVVTALSSPYGLGIDSTNGRVFISDVGGGTYANGVVVYNIGFYGVPVSSVTIGSSPVGLAFDSSLGYMFVTRYSATSAGVYKINTTSFAVSALVSSSFGNIFNNPTGIAVRTSKREVYVANTGTSSGDTDSSILKITYDNSGNATAVTTFLSGTSVNDMLCGPVGLAINGNTLYVSNGTCTTNNAYAKSIIKISLEN